MVNKQILAKGQVILEKYEVIFFIKRGSYAETYRVKGNDGQIKFLKLFIYSQLDRTQFTDSSTPLEIDILKSIRHPNLVQYHDSGELVIDNQKYGFVILDFVIGETLAERMSREGTLNPYDAKEIILGVLNGVSHLHNMDRSLIHNDITNLNVMLDLTGQVPVPKLIDFGYARWIDQATNDFLKEGLNPFYQSNEAFNKVFSVQNDIFSIGALYYHMLFGMPPWFIEISKFKNNRIELEDAIIEERRKKLKLLESDISVDDYTIQVISKALQPNAEYRFGNVKQFTQAINGELEIQLSEASERQETIKPKKIEKGKGFSSIAGMEDLKELIKVDVIDALNEKEKYAEYGLTIPNGMLLYGPPGCGKTFFAEKMAEEIGFSFYQIKPSDIQSKWVNASQENIKLLFDEARDNAPSIIFIDELDAVVPNRDKSSVNHMNTSAVNEFLAQMNNCGDDGIFIIGATNRPNQIDPAILRAGRLDKLIYLPPPDMEARTLMFKLYLEKRPREVGLDYTDFAKATENYVSSDIKFLCDEASRKALRLKTRISNKIIIDTIKLNKPSISLNEIKQYVEVKSTIDGEAGDDTNQQGIGFKYN